MEILLLVFLFGGGWIVLAWMLLGFMAGFPARWIYNRFILKNVPPRSRPRRSRIDSDAIGCLTLSLLLFSFWFGDKWAKDLAAWVLAIIYFIYAASWAWWLMDASESEEEKGGPKPNA